VRNDTSLASVKAGRLESWLMAPHECGMRNHTQCEFRIADCEFDSPEPAKTSTEVPWYSRAVSPGNAGSGMSFGSLALGRPVRLDNARGLPYSRAHKEVSPSSPSR
jgi:hypothetical protein